MHSNASVEEEEEREGKQGFYEVNESVKVKMSGGKHLVFFTMSNGTFGNRKLLHAEWDFFFFLSDNNALRLVSPEQPGGIVVYHSF